MRGVVLARLRSPKVRKGTQYWSDRVKSAQAGINGGGQDSYQHYEVKALDADRVAPDSLTGEIVDTLRPVVLGVARDAASDVAQRLGHDLEPEGGMFEIDHDLLNDLVDEALEDLLHGAQRYAADVRAAVLDGDAKGMSLDDLLDTVGAALDHGGTWLRLDSRTVATALAGKAQLEQARALGVTHAQWVSRRDGRVRPTHVKADGQVRLIGEHFHVGGCDLEYPGDPSGLPETDGEVLGCRCGLIFADADDDLLSALGEISKAVAAEHDGADAPAATALIAAAATADEFTPAPEVEGLPGIAQVVPAPQDVVGWRVLDGVLDAEPGQRVTLPAGTVLGLASPRDLSTATLAVLVPRDTPVAVAGGTMTLPDAATVEVLAAGEGGMQGRLV